METVDVDLSEVSGRKAGAMLVKTLSTAAKIASEKRRTKKSMG